MRHNFFTRRSLRWSLVAIVLAAVATLTLTAPWPSAAHNLDPRTSDVIPHHQSDRHPNTGSSFPEKRLAQARAVLAERLQVLPARLRFVSEEEVRWPDTSLGCPEPGGRYGKAIIPGYRITFSYEDALYEVHTAKEDRPVPARSPVSCEGGFAYAG